MHRLFFLRLWVRRCTNTAFGLQYSYLKLKGMNGVVQIRELIAFVANIRLRTSAARLIDTLRRVGICRILGLLSARACFAVAHARTQVVEHLLLCFARSLYLGRVYGAVDEALRVAVRAADALAHTFFAFGAVLIQLSIGSVQLAPIIKCASANFVDFVLLHERFEAGQLLRRILHLLRLGDNARTQCRTGVFVREYKFAIKNTSQYRQQSNVD